MTFDMAIGGTEQVIRQLVENRDADRYVHIVACIDNAIGELGVELQARNVAVIRLARRPGFDMALVRALRAMIKAQRIDIVHCHQYTPYVYGLLAAVWLPAKVVFTEHGRFYPDIYKWKRAVINPLFARFTAAITAISQATANALVN